MSVQSERTKAFSTWLEVQSMHHLLSNDKIRWRDDGSDNYLNSVVKTTHEFMSAINSADSYIISRLSNKYSEDDLRGATVVLNDSLHLFPPIGKKADGSDNSGGELSHVSLDTDYDQYSAVWKITFTSVTEFTVYSFLEGSQGSGRISSTFTSTNKAVQILSAYWEDTTYASGDVYWFSVARATRIINTISKTLAAAFLLNEITGDQSPEESGVGNKLYTRAMTWLEMLRNGTMALSYDDQQTIDLSPKTFAYNIDRYGDSNETVSR